MFCVCWLLFCYSKADRQARAWHEVTASNAPSVRNGHTSVIDAQQRIWIFGGYKSGLSLKILAGQALLGLIRGRKKPCSPNVLAVMWA